MKRSSSVCLQFFVGYGKMGISGVELRSNMGGVLTVVMFWCQWSWSIIGYWNPLEYITLLLT